MEEKEVVCKDEKLWRGIAKTVVNRYHIKEHLLYESSLSCSPTLSYIPDPDAPRILPQQDIGIVDSGATHFYIAPSEPHDPPNTSASPISVGTANGQVEKSSATSILPILQLESEFPTTG